MAVVMLISLALAGTLPESLFLPLMLMAMGGGALGYNAVRLPGWAAEREEQMERVAARAVALLGGGPASRDARAQLAGAPGLDADGAVAS
jgi:hypothetical protein